MENNIDNDITSEGILITLFLFLFIQPLYHLYMYLSNYIEANITDMVFFIYIVPFFLVLYLPFQILQIINFLFKHTIGLDVDNNIYFAIGIFVFLINLDYYLTGSSFVFKMLALIANFLF